MEDLEVQAAVAKIAKYAVRESGDTVEVVERPHGGISIVVADGQRSGRSAKIISNLVARKAISLIAEGVRDGAVARAAHDYLRTLRRGKVSAELSIVSVDLVTRTMVLSRNSQCPIFVWQDETLHRLDTPSEAVGIYHYTKPAIEELPIRSGTVVSVFTDGVLHAGERFGDKLDVQNVILTENDPNVSAQHMADHMLDQAVSLDRGRPRDDATVLVVKVCAQPERDQVRRLAISFPI